MVYRVLWKFARLVCCLAPAIAVAWLFVKFLLQTRRSDPADLLRQSMEVFIVAAIVWAVGVWRVLPRRSIEMLIIAVTALVIHTSVHWNVIYRTYAATIEHRHEAFRNAMSRSAYTPIYGDTVLPITRQHMLLAAVGGAAVACGSLIFIFARRRWRVLAWACLFASQALTIACFAKTDETTRLGPDVAGYMNFKPDVARFISMRDMLRNYVEAMPTLEWFDRHYPPGNLMLFWLQYHWHILHFAKSIVILGAMLTALPLYWLCRELRLGETAARIAVALYGCSVAVVMYPTVNTTSLIALPSALFVAAIVRAIRRSETWPAVVAGMAVLMFWMISFSWIIVGGVVGLMAIFALLLRRARVARVAKAAAVSLATLVIAIALLWLVFRFNLLAATRTGVQEHAKQMGIAPFAPPKRWLIRSGGNVLGYLLSIGPLLGLALIATWPRRRNSSRQPLAMPLFISTWLLILAAGFGGLFCLETERVWVFFTPLIAAAAGYALSRHMRRVAGARRRPSDNHPLRAAPDRFVILTAILSAVAFVTAFELIMRPYK